MQNDGPNRQGRIYSQNYPGLNRLASGALDHPAAGFDAGNAINDQHVLDASRQHKRRKNLYKADQATAHEVMVAERRKIGIIVENTFNTIPVGRDWAEDLARRIDLRFDQMQEGVNGRLDQMQEAMNGVNGRLDRIDGRLDRIEGRLDVMDGRLIEVTILSKRNANSNLLLLDEAIESLPNTQGAYPRENLVPSSLNGFVTMTLQDADELVAFYRLPVRRRDNLNVKTQRLLNHFGLKHTSNVPQN